MDNKKKKAAKTTDDKKASPKAATGNKKLKVKRLTVGDLDQDITGGSDSNCQANTVC
jgi:hypothetical protein